MSQARFAGPGLAKYLSQVAGKVLDFAGYAGQKVSNKLANNPFLTTVGAGTADEAAAAIRSIPGVGKYLAKAPISTYQAAAANLPQIAGGLTTLGVGTAAPYAFNQLVQYGSRETEPFANQQAPGGSPMTNYQAGEAEPFANQQAPGGSPMTNYQAGEALLSNQRYQQQLQLMRMAEYESALKYQQQLGIIRARENASNQQGTNLFSGGNYQNAMTEALTATREYG